MCWRAHVRARALDLFIEETLISGRAVCLFPTNRHCCEILWANVTNRTRHYLAALSLFWRRPAPPAPLQLSLP